MVTVGRHLTFSNDRAEKISRGGEGIKAFFSIPLLDWTECEVATNVHHVAQDVQGEINLLLLLLL